MSVTLRPLHRASDDDAVRAIFRATLGLGRPVPFPLPGLARYECLCLDWYLRDGRGDAAVVVRDGTVVGYTLVCADPDAFSAALRREAVRFAAWAGPRVVGRRLPDPARTFWRLRLEDGWLAWRAGADAPDAHAHAYLNLLPHARGTSAGLQVLDHIDERVGAHGRGSWTGEVNARRGRRVTALTRLVGHVVASTPNRTYTWLAGTPVDRLTVRRTLTN